VDKLNPKQASIYAMQQAVKQLKIKPDILLIDAEKLNTNIESKSIIKGDQRSLAIAAASILAKVTRDRYMIQIDNKYPQYHFKQNKGYGTIDHLKALRIHGPIKKFHRYSYKPIKAILDQAAKKQIQL
jgi:ribonuclease HII